MNDDLAPNFFVDYPPRPPRRRLRWSRLSVLAVAALALAGIGFVLATNLPATFAAAGQSTPSSTSGSGGPAMDHMRGGPGHDLTVSSVSGSDIVAKDENGASVTIHTNSSTTFERAGTKISLSALTSGTTIDVRGTRNSDGTITATDISIALPVYAGKVTKISGNTIIVTSPRDSATQTITVSSSTVYTRAGISASLSDVAVGSYIAAEGTVNSDKSLAAARVDIDVPHVEGQIVSVSGSDITLRDPFGGTLTIHTTASTKATSVTFGASGPTQTTIALSSLKAGDQISAAGTQNSDGSLNALTVTLMTNAPSGQPGHGSPGFGPGGPGFGPGDPGDGLAPAA
ncbi:MAG TPA: DUF5666 domain-containing protein [Ktedonobacterales bacterium]|nr:DUF5666 domain-containing protein [Ktedonobacterales bacterium]